MGTFESLASVAELCKDCAKITLDHLLSLGPKPMDATKGLLWDQQATRLQNQLDSLTALVSKLTAEAVIEGLKNYQPQLDHIGTLTKEARVEIQHMAQVSASLTKFSKVLDLGLAILSAAASPSLAAISAAVAASDTLVHP